jgi:hypothetical protein
MIGYARVFPLVTEFPAYAASPLQRVILGFVVAPVLPAFYATLFFAQPWAFPYGIALAYPCALLLGLPIYLVLRRKQRLGWWQLGLTGMVCAAPTVIAYRTIGTPPHLEPFEWLSAFYLLAWGGFAGISFWLLAVAGKTPVTARMLFGIVL